MGTYTTYTADIIDGKIDSLASFAKICTTKFNGDTEALATQEANIVYLKEQLIEAYKDFNKLLAITPEEALEQEKSEYQENIQNSKASNLQNLLEIERITSMIKLANNWNPTESTDCKNKLVLKRLEDLKTFMIDQLDLVLQSRNNFNFREVNWEDNFKHDPNWLPSKWNDLLEKIEYFCQRLTRALTHQKETQNFLVELDKSLSINAACPVDQLNRNLAHDNLKP